METQETDSKKLDEKEQIQHARDFRDILHTNFTIAERRTAELCDEFARLEVQIATIFFAFSSLFLNLFHDSVMIMSKFGGGFIFMKLSFAFALASLLASLIFGMIQIKRKEFFWGEILNQRILRYTKWHQVAKKKATFEEAEAYFEGTSLDKGIFRSTPNWPWVLQTIFLAISVAILYTLALVFLFM